MTSTWEETLDDWLATYRTQLPALRAAYMSEVGRLAEKLRPRFESGELRGFTADDGESDARTPQFELAELCRAHFRIDDLHEVAVVLMLDLTPRAAATACVLDADNTSRLESAITWDVIAVARAREWYTPSPKEGRDPLTIARCATCNHVDEAHKPACRVLDCDCDRLGVHGG